MDSQLANFYKSLNDWKNPGLHKTCLWNERERDRQKWEGKNGGRKEGMSKVGIKWTGNDVLYMYM